MLRKSLAQKIAEDVVDIQSSWVNVIGEKRGTRFKVNDWLPLLQLKEDLEPHEGQSKEVFNLYLISARAGYDVISGLTDYISPQDEPWLEHYQTTAVFEILYEYDKDFREASNKLARAIERSDDLIQREIFARFYGRYGPTWIVDYVATPGSFSNLLKKILYRVNMKEGYRRTFINAVSGARNTSYSVMFGSKFLEALNQGKRIKDAMQAEKEMLKEMWLNPIETQLRIMKELGHESFDYKRCLASFKEKIYEAVIDAAENGVHYANLSLIPLWGAGDFHHISQTTYNLCKGDVEFAILESLTGVLESTLRKAKKEDRLRDPRDIPTWEVTASGSAYIMRLDGFTSSMVAELLIKRFYNLIMKDPRLFAYECMNEEFVNFLGQGEYFIERPPKGLGCKVMDVQIDLSPIDRNEVLKNPQEYSWPECPITCRFSALLRFADEPFHLVSDPMVCLYAMELIALKPDEPYLPYFFCKRCISSRYLPYRCEHCLATKNT